jgi:hypothetical protein
MGDRTVKFVRASEISGSTPGRPGGIVAIVVDDLSHETPMTAVQYHNQPHAKIRIFDLWQEVRFLDPRDIHPDDYRALYPEDAKLTDQAIIEILKRVASRFGPRP